MAMAAQTARLLPHSASSCNRDLYPSHSTSSSSSTPLRKLRISPRFLIRTQHVRSPFHVSATYSSGSNGSVPIDVVAKIQTQKILVLGGNGFVGSAICKAAVAQGIDVVSLNRSGRPSYNDAWSEQVVWVAGDVFYADWDSLFNGVTAVISTLGGFGNNEEMERLNGEANVLAINAAKNLGIRKFIYVSVHDYNIPNPFKNIGYFTGKKRAEDEILRKFSTNGTILRPGFIYGKRRVNGIDIPLDLVGEPLGKILEATKPLTRPLSVLPASDILFAPPLSVDDVAYVAIKAVTDDDVYGIQTIEQIRELSSARSN